MKHELELSISDHQSLQHDSMLRSRTSTSGGEGDRDDGISEYASAYEGEQQPGDPIPTIARKETTVVLRLKLIVLLVLISSATLVGVSTHKYLLTNEQQKFETQFREEADKVLEGFGSSLQKSFGLLDSVAVHTVSTARTTRQEWPFVTIPDFAVKTAKILPLTNSIAITFLPLVSPELRRAWEQYTIEYEDWVDESQEIQQEWDEYYGPIVYNGTHNSAVHNDFGIVPYNISRPVLPSWQQFPVIANDTLWTYNYDWFEVSFAESYWICIEQHKAVVTLPYMIPRPDDPLAQAQTDIWADYYQFYLKPGEESREPMSDLSYPILDNIDHVKVAGAASHNVTDDKVLGMIVASFYWREQIQNILPDGSNGIQIVFDNGCTDSFTYQINGPSVEYLGVGDHHSGTYDRFGIHRKIHDVFTMPDSTYSGAHLDADYCHFTLHLYPSDDMLSTYRTQDPIMFTVSAIFIFVFTSAVFLLYDAMVERRQRTVMTTAVRTSAIVSSLFPPAVRDRLYPGTIQSTAEKRRFTFPAKAGSEPFTEQVRSSNLRLTGDPIAELYPDTTVLFADIAGFTAWSATRLPTDVFHLLETIYAAFDDIAKQLGVFKVETIGDCYLAVVGLPTPRQGHASIMAQFASACRNKMQEITVKLVEELGPGTEKLALRIGLNSGPTTAGVLRGEKSRFQVFGDTVNTAARMESNGEPNRIHISQQTADLVAAEGHRDWLTPRTEQVECKGKGLMTTYWCEPCSQRRFSSYKDTTAMSSLAKVGAACDES